MAFPCLATTPCSQGLRVSWSDCDLVVLGSARTINPLLNPSKVTATRLVNVPSALGKGARGENYARSRGIRVRCIVPLGYRFDPTLWSGNGSAGAGNSIANADKA